MGDSGEKKLDLLLSLGVAGKFCKLSMVLSESDGRERFRSTWTVGSEGSTYSWGVKTSSSRKPCLDAVRKPSIGPSWSWFSSSSVLASFGAVGGNRCWLARDDGLAPVVRDAVDGLAECLVPLGPDARDADGVAVAKGALVVVEFDP